jgi:hypothetical protein
LHNGSRRTARQPLFSWLMAVFDVLADSPRKRTAFLNTAKIREPLAKISEL